MALDNHRKHISTFLTKNIWLQELDQLKSWRLLLVRIVRTILIVIHDFFRDKCVLRASALAFTTLLALVPLAAVGFSLLKAFGVKEYIQNWILKTLTADMQSVAETINEAISNINATTMQVTGLCVLLVSSVLLIGNMEQSFNEIWYIRKGRSILRKFSDYLSVLIVGPILVAVALTMTTSFQSTTWFQSIKNLDVIYQFILFMSPFISIWIGMVFINMFMPNTKVRFIPALIGSVISGTLWIFAQKFYLFYQVRIFKANVIYGSFAQLPLFLVWMYISWVVTLLGAEITFAIQNLASYSTERRKRQLSQSFEEMLALRMVIAVGRAFYQREPGWNIDRFSTEWRVPYDIIAEVVDLLCRTQILVEIPDKNNTRLVPAQPFEELSIAEVLQTIRDYGDSLTLIKPDVNDKVLTQLYPTIKEQSYSGLQEMRIKDILFPKSNPADEKKLSIHPQEEAE